MSTEPLLRGLFLLAVLLPAVALASPTVVVRIDGLSGEPLANVRASLSLENTGLRGRLTAKTIRQLYRDSSREIARALEPFGYYRPQIAASLREPGAPDSPWLASFQIDPGEVVPVTDMDIAFVGEGANDADLAQAARASPLQPGQGLDHRRYEETKQDLLARAQAFGYRDASLVAHRVEVDLATYSASVVIRVATGPRFVIGAIEFDQDEFKPEFLARYLLLEPGEPYTGSALARQRQALSRSGYFREVEIEPQPPADSAPDVIPLRIRLETFPRNRYRGRLTWGTDTGAGAQLDWNRRYLGSRGQHFTAGIAAVEERNKIAADLSYVIPLSPLDGSKFTLGARHESKDLNFKDVDLNEGGETRIETNLFSFNWRRPDRRWQGFDLKPTAGLTLLSENYDVFEVLFGNLSKAGQQVIIDAIGRSAYDTLTPDFEAVIPTLRLNLRRSNDRLFISDGDLFDLQLLGASESIGSNLSFWQARLNTWHIRELGADGRLLLRTNLGYSDANSSEVLGVNFNEMPEYYEFRAGGALSVRGYSFESLYPSDSITGGKHQLVGSIEYDYEFIPKFSLALFVDAGNAFNRWQDYDARVGTGIGLRWRSPVGMARIDLGVPLNDSDESFQVYITVGPEF